MDDIILIIYILGSILATGMAIGYGSMSKRGIDPLIVAAAVLTSWFVVGLFAGGAIGVIETQVNNKIERNINEQNSRR